MVTKKFYFWLAFIVFAASACGSSDDENGEKTKDGGSGEEDAEVSPSDDAGPTDGDGGVVVVEDAGDIAFALCGNGKVEPPEECDDGNMNQRDGCTSLCTFSCLEDADCDDMNPCNGTETCDEDKHACDDSDPGIEEGESCGDQSYCWQGVCIPNVCGDGKVVEGIEQCDDGDKDWDNGCTPECEYSCEEDSDCSGRDECLGDRVCENNACVGGTALEDETPCTIVDTRIKELCGDPDDSDAKDGWCMNGECTCTDCGDGEIQGIEECDDGELNGTDKSPNNCSINCQEVECGNGDVEGDEECDDGNNQLLDGCDAQCKYEFAHRFTKLEIVKGAENVPEWCEYQANQFAEAFGSEQNMMGAGIRINILDTVNRRLSSQLASGENTYILHVMDSDDTSMKTQDDEIIIGTYQGNPSGAATENAVDQAFVVKASQIDPDTRMPAEYHSVPAAQLGGGKIISKGPIRLEMVGPMGSYMMRDFKMQTVYDVNTSTTPNVEQQTARDTLKVSDSLKLPETSGQNRTGLFCGAMESGATDIPIYDGGIEDLRGMDTGQSFGPMARFCCKNIEDEPEFGEKYNACDKEAGELPPDCDSISDLIQHGCTVCVDFSGAAIDMMGIFETGSDCSLLQSNPDACFKIINGIPFDVDSDGVSGNDTWSSLFSFETVRTRIYDVTLK
ncbi:MAG: DUF4215 domain-containing protein [Deltaproteobacteria bacterium]|nr:DUF4215 domain-containing protein [Deltaproteobacteria bacterium]